MWIYIYIIIFKEAEASIRALIEEIAQFLHFEQHVMQEWSNYIQAFWVV